MVMVWPCELSVEVYVEAGRHVVVPARECPSCSAVMGWWSGYWRDVRHGGLCCRLFIRRVRCGACRVSHAVLPAFLLAGRLDAVGTVGSVIEEVAFGVGVRPAARRVDVPPTTARDWWWRFRQRAERMAVAFAAVAVELGGRVTVPVLDRGRWAVSALRASWGAAVGLPGWAPLGLWRFASAVTGGMLMAANTDPLSIVIGKRRFIPPVP